MNVMGKNTTRNAMHRLQVIKKFPKLKDFFIKKDWKTKYMVTMRQPEQDSSTKMTTEPLR